MRCYASTTSKLMNPPLCALTAGLLALCAATHADELKIDKAKSRIQVDAKATGHTFTGTLDDFKATVTGDRQSLLPSSVNLSWKFADLKTGDEKRDKEMIKWLGDKSPSGSFKFTKTWIESGKTYAQGSLTIHGISKTIAFPFTATKNGNWVTIDGTASLDYQDFGLPIIKNMAVMKVSPELSVRFHLVGTAD